MAAPTQCLPHYGGINMRKIILMVSVSLDGFFEGPERDISCDRVRRDLA